MHVTTQAKSANSAYTTTRKRTKGDRCSVVVDKSLKECSVLDLQVYLMVAIEETLDSRRNASLSVVGAEWVSSRIPEPPSSSSKFRS